VRIVSRCVDCAFISSGWAAVCPFSWAGGVSLPGGGEVAQLLKGPCGLEIGRKEKGREGGVGGVYGCGVK
jgi:hypothetical protein